MKKQTYLMTLIVANLLIAESLMAQFSADRISAVGGVSYCTITGDSDSWKGTIGGQLGVIYNVVDLSEFLSARAELNISLMGAGWEDDFGEGTVSGRTNLTYLNIPLVVRYQTEGGFFGEAGIQPGFLLSAKDKYEGDSFDYKEYLSSFDFSIIFGLGYEFENNLGVGIRVIPGLTNVNSSEYADEYKDHNFVVAGRVTYTFRKK
jgi:outer membrane immunogenic protein